MVPDVPAGDPTALDAEGYEEWCLGGMIQLDPGDTWRRAAGPRP